MQRQSLVSSSPIVADTRVALDDQSSDTKRLESRRRHQAAAPLVTLFCTNNIL
jgi:hypothetical protein